MMKNPIVDKLEPIVLVGGGALGAEDLSLAQSVGSTCIAADGGARAVLAAGLVPEAVIGDFDSLTAEDRARIPPARLHHIAEQDSTDFDKALRHVASPLVVGVGFTGARVDHQLAALNTLVRHAHRAVILLGEAEAIFHVPRQLSLDLDPGETISLMPLTRMQARSTGLRWALDPLDLDPSGIISTSNEATGPVTLSPQAPGLLGLIARQRFSALAQALLDLPSAQYWPAPA